MTAIVTALGLAALLGFAGLAVDVGAWLYATRNMQAAADQAAYSAATAAGTGGCPSVAATLEARAVAAAHGYVSGVHNTTVTPRCQASTSSFTVTISQGQPMWFSALFLASAPTASVSAGARLATAASDLCVLALDGTNFAAAQAGSDADAAELGGNTTLNLRCGIAVDSSSLSAFAVGGHGSVTATDIYLVGDDQGSPSGSGTLTTSPTPNNILRYQPIVDDPYLDRTIPTLTSCTQTQSGGYNPADGTVPAGTYCGGLTFGSNGGGHSDNYTLSGTYYVVGGSLTINASANITATGVTFVLTGNTLGQTGYATLTVNGNSSISLTAPTSGPYGGMAFFQDRNAPFSSNATCGNGNAQNKINGGANQLITGAIYFPNQSICFTGNSSTSGPGQCTQLIGRTLDFIGTSSLALSCSGTGITPISVPTAQLVQ